MPNSKRVTIKDLIEEIEKLKIKTQEVDILKKKIADLEKELQSIKNKNEYQSAETISRGKFPCIKCDKMFCTPYDLKKHEKSKHPLTNIKCKSCESVFNKYSDLESHLDTVHKVEKFGCEICDKTFALKWRLNKHQQIHNNKNIRKCHYFNNQKTCPYEQIGCMFEHSAAGECKNGDICKVRLCSFEHRNNLTDKNNSKDETKTNEETDEERSFDLYVKTNFSEIYDYYLTNQKHIPCYFCDYISKSQVLKSIENEMINHMDTNHEDIIEVFKSDDTEIENIIHLEFLEFFVPE